MVEEITPSRRALSGSGGFVFFDGKLTATKHNFIPAVRTFVKPQY